MTETNEATRKRRAAPNGLAGRSPAALATVCGIISAGALIGAYWIEFGLGIEPCSLCYLGRWPHFAILLGVAVILCSTLDNGVRNAKMAPRLRCVGAGLLAVAALAGMTISFYHSGVEWNWWLGFESCAPQVHFDPTSLAPDTLKQSLQKSRIANCSEPAMTLFGLSLANWNGIITFAIFLLAGAAMHTIVCSTPGFSSTRTTGAEG